jgi:hypothetical protein
MEKIFHRKLDRRAKGNQMNARAKNIKPPDLIDPDLAWVIRSLGRYRQITHNSRLILRMIVILEPDVDSAL